MKKEKCIFNGKILNISSDLDNKIELSNKIITYLVDEKKSNNIGELYGEIFNNMNEASIVIEYRLMTPIESLHMFIQKNDYYNLDNYFTNYNDKTHFLSPYKGYILISKDDIINSYKIINYSPWRMKEHYNSTIDILSNLVLFAKDLKYEKEIKLIIDYLNSIKDFKKALHAKYIEFKNDTMEYETRIKIYKQSEDIAILKRLMNRIMGDNNQYDILFKLNSKEELTYGLLDILSSLYSIYRLNRSINKENLINYLSKEDTENSGVLLVNVLNNLFSDLWFY